MSETAKLNYTYENGCKLEVEDYGDDGMILRLSGGNDNLAIMMPPDKVKDFRKFLKLPVAEIGKVDSLLKLLGKLDKSKGKTYKFRRGDKTLVKNTLATFKK